MTFSEIILTATIWALTGIGCFFGLRAAIRRRKKAARDHRDADNGNRP